jgi:hypothetical protein
MKVCRRAAIEPLFGMGLRNASPKKSLVPAFAGRQTPNARLRALWPSAFIRYRTRRGESRQDWRCWQCTEMKFVYVVPSPPLLTLPPLKYQAEIALKTKPPPCLK